MRFNNIYPQFLLSRHGMLVDIYDSYDEAFEVALFSGWEDFSIWQI